jgi:branched-chain amino acid transport system substrate-binding protein
MNAVTPTQIVIKPGEFPEGTAWRQLVAAQALVIWTDSAMAERVASRAREVLPTVPIYLCRKAAEGDTIAERQLACPPCGNKDSARWIAAAPERREVRAGFCQRYRRLYGAEPSLGAAEAYDAVRVLAAALRRSGLNRARLRDALVGVNAFAGASGDISFDHAGNNIAQVSLLKLK